MQLKKQYAKMVATDPELQGKIAKETNKSVQAVKIWGEKPNHEKLLMKPVLGVLMQFTGVQSEDDLIEKAA